MGLQRFQSKRTFDGNAMLMWPTEFATSIGILQSTPGILSFSISHIRCSANNNQISRYWESTTFLKEGDRTEPITFYDSNTGKPLFIAPKGRTFQDFVAESKSHGWPSFRDEEVVWENVRCLRDGETVTISRILCQIIISVIKVFLAGFSGWYTSRS